MQVEIESRNVKLDPEVRGWIERRLHHALGRFGARLSLVRVGLEDVNGPRGGPDVRCRLRARLARAGPPVVEAVESDAALAVSRALDRLVCALRNRIRRRRDVSRRADGSAATP
jgi:ribosome-associated translation inhibitor RaiA